ncbi:ADP-ribosylation factor-like protein 13B [Brevipalpus obovatus]|uniref:ADP-ribosylation factor-like protein 13B n=1 Tax=Brevipalpus obovatus TaxID=246614 RepID=UPI003D9E032D
MGCCWQKRRKRLIQLMLIGLDGAGKTSFARYLMKDPSNNLVPTIGFSSHDLKNSHRYAVRLYDVGGGKNIRDIWRNYYPLVHGFVLLIDSTDENRLEYVREVLQDTLANDCVRGKPILVLANKQDVENALDEFEVCQKIHLNATVNKYECPTKVESCSLLNKWGLRIPKNALLDRGYAWLVQYIMNNWDHLENRVAIEARHQIELEQKIMMQRIKKFRGSSRSKNKRDERLNKEDSSNSVKEKDPLENSRDSGINGETSPKQDPQVNVNSTETNKDTRCDDTDGQNDVIESVTESIVSGEKINYKKGKFSRRLNRNMRTKSAIFGTNKIVPSNRARLNSG